jgi:hypothetical protein
MIRSREKYRCSITSNAPTPSNVALTTGHCRYSAEWAVS